MQQCLHRLARLCHGPEEGSFGFFVPVVFFFFCLRGGGGGEGGLGFFGVPFGGGGREGFVKGWVFGGAF